MALLEAASAHTPTAGAASSGQQTYSTDSAAPLAVSDHLSKVVPASAIT